MASVNEIAIRTSIAAVHNGSHLRVYETDIEGKIRETQYEGKWTGGTSSNVIGSGRIGTPVSATSLGLSNIRVYFIGADSKVHESCYDSGHSWYNGALTEKGFDVAPYSGISGVYLDNHSVLRVYGQLANNTIQEWCWDNNGNGWTTGTNFGAALPGTSIAATSWGNGSPHHYIRLYYQDTSLNIIEKAWDGTGWYTGGLHFSNGVTRTTLGVTSWSEGSSVKGIRLYYSAPSNIIKEKAWDGNGWYDGGFSQPSIPASNVAALPLPVLRVYLQNGTQGTAVTEFAWNGGWVVGHSALPPA
ncbi:hypothetical protein V2G26_002782 [Clonostachys chloroleuca]